MLYGFVNGQDLRLAQPVIASNTNNYLEMEFVFQSFDWTGLIKWVHFKKVGDTTVYDIKMEDCRIEKNQHLNLTTGIWEVYLHGNDLEGTERATTIVANLEVQETGWMCTPLPEIPLTAAEQISADAAKALELANSVVEGEVGRVEAEKQRVVNEGQRISNENLREEYETNREIAEDSRVVAESKRISNENERIDAEKKRVIAEDRRVTSEDAREVAEKSRADEWTAIQQEAGENFPAYANAEKTREANEKIRVSNENQRLFNENIRKTNESKRVQNETLREEHEVTREANEKTRITNETSRVEAEKLRATNDSKWSLAEQKRETNEVVRERNETKRVQAEKDRKYFIDDKVTSPDFTWSGQKIQNGFDSLFAALEWNQ